MQRRSKSPTQTDQNMVQGLIVGEYAPKGQYHCPYTGGMPLLVPHRRISVLFDATASGLAPFSS